MMHIDDVLDPHSQEMNELFSAIRIGSNKIFNYKKLRKSTLLGETFLTNKEVCEMLSLGLRKIFFSVAPLSNVSHLWGKCGENSDIKKA